MSLGKSEPTATVDLQLQCYFPPICRPSLSAFLHSSSSGTVASSSQLTDDAIADEETLEVVANGGSMD